MAVPPPPGAPGSVDIRVVVRNTRHEASHRHCSSFTTRGVRADRVWVKPSSRAAREGSAGRRGSSKADLPLACETSAGNRRQTHGASVPCGSAAVPPVLGDAGRGRRRAKAHARRVQRAGKAGVGRSARLCSRIVLVAEVDEQRSVQGRKTAGLARRHGCREAAAHTERTGAGSRIAVAKATKLASGETGGGLLVIPRTGAQAHGATGGGSTRTMEGVLAFRERRP